MTSSVVSRAQVAPEANRDFAPTGSARDSELQAVAERLFRSAGNGHGRSRMGADGRLRSQKAPRGLVLATGEEVPAGQRADHLTALERQQVEDEEGWILGVTDRRR